VNPKQPADSPRKPSQVLKRSINIAGHKTSVSLEDAFWGALREIAATRKISLSDLVSTIDNERQHGNLSSAMRHRGLASHRPAGR
jgi:predicted DNA-binding ribbon-helix-helix protein